MYVLKLCHPLKRTACFPLRKKKSNKKICESVQEMSSELVHIYY